MNAERLKKYRSVLRDMARRVTGTVEAVEEAARSATGGQASGNLSNAPMHLGDVGSEVYTQELNATLLENEAYIAGEVGEALGRVDAGTFGRCENCGEDIPEERLDALPYTRYCVPCAGRLQAGVAVNLNDGRPEGWGSTFEQPGTVAPKKREGEQSPFTAARVDSATTADDDLHAAGTPGGGTAVGGLAGTNIGEGDPANAVLEDAMGSGNYDVALEGEEAEDAPNAYAGSGGGAVGGTPANKRAVGGKTGGGIEPRPGPGESATGQ